MALQLLFVMDATAVAPNVVSFNSTIGACETGLGCHPWLPLVDEFVDTKIWRSHHVGNQRIQPSRDDLAPARPVEDGATARRLAGKPMVSSCPKRGS